MKREKQRMMKTMMMGMAIDLGDGIGLMFFLHFLSLAVKGRPPFFIFIFFGVGFFK